MLDIYRGMSAVLLGACVLIGAAKADEEKPEPKVPLLMQNATDNPSESEALATPEADANRYVVPDGAPKELIEYIEGLIAEPPRDAETRTKIRKAILEAAEKIMAAKPNEEEMEFAVEAKMSMIEKPEELAGFAAELAKAGHKKAVRQVQGFLRQMELREAMLQNPESMKKAIGEAVRFLEEAPPQPSDVALAFMAGRMSEMTNDGQFATATYNALQKIFASSKDDKMAEFTKVLNGVVRRLNLVGKPLKIEGTLLDGTVFDWSQYAGKIVLIDFCAMEYPPCAREIPNLKKCYQQYHDKGFDIVGISLDRNRDDLTRYVKEHELPWAVLAGDDKPNPTIAYYGIMSLPTMFLVGKDGNVISTNLQGKTLEKTLQKIFNPAEPQAETALPPTPKKPASKLKPDLDKPAAVP